LDKGGGAVARGIRRTASATAAPAWSIQVTAKDGRSTVFWIQPEYFPGDSAPRLDESSIRERFDDEPGQERNDGQVQADVVNSKFATLSGPARSEFQIVGPRWNHMVARDPV